MDINEANKIIQERINKARAYVESDEVKDTIANIAIKHFSDSFKNEGFTDKKLEEWTEVERRKSDSKWYGHSSQSGKFSRTRTTANILTGESSLMNKSFGYEKTDAGIKILNYAPYARVHQYGLPSKIYGKKVFQMPARPFMGQSKVLKQNIELEIGNRIKNILEGK